MTPQFPNFQKIQIADKPFFDSYLKSFPPYSDFNFVSLWSYNDGDNRFCMLNENLVIKLSDYMTNKPLYTFLGKKRVLNTLNTLIDFVSKMGVEPKLKLLPEFNINNSINSLQKHFLISEDTNSFDYILLIDNMVDLNGPNYKMHRNMIRKFSKQVKKFDFIELDLKEPFVKKQILNLSYYWAQRKGKTIEEAETELTAIKNLLNDFINFNLSAYGLYIDNELAAFFIMEIVHKHNRYAIGHFRKANTTYPGIFQFMDHKVAQALKKNNCIYFNYEQDLGIESLRKAKLSWHPAFFLKKYTVSPK
ncbi:TPA: hypothetical protein DIV55_00855 [Patescibacteria group bacterium]|uniref:Phosphatidylglycerol lysyltransferase C-terminal domain-containing protein n=1 Tax=Candidatus Gottesmanbacteria bacterium GW2011_GWA1_43_11 TaxID=1618436 RepID=A0A0G1CEV1_9BACT|nr:MAG: hypothetical protein UV59_C0022G0020 [Candidatus Gottesmanbacteria bacterium GW2011_GWA1_43_11]HCS78274.1 hypothetical protein [Patescibacteria group bacterium]